MMILRDDINGQLKNSYGMQEVYFINKLLLTMLCQRKDVESNKLSEINEWTYLKNIGRKKKKKRKIFLEWLPKMLKHIVSKRHSMVIILGYSQLSVTHLREALACLLRKRELSIV